MRIVISNNSELPIYEQICRQIRDGIVTGELVPGASLPSIRSLASDLQVSVITTKRAYEELEKDGFIETVPGKGSFVAPHNQELLREKRMSIIEEKLAQLVQESKRLGISREDLRRILDLLYEEG